MTRFHWWFVLMIFGINSTVLSQLPPSIVSEGTLATSVREVVGDDVAVTWEECPISDALRQQFHRLFDDGEDHFFIGKINTPQRMDVLISRARGKVENFMFAVYFNRETGQIWDVDVLEYREAYGGEIDYRAFRRQFKGKSSTREIVFRRTIRNISGATISARSITKRVREILSFYEFLRNQKDEPTGE